MVKKKKKKDDDRQTGEQRVERQIKSQLNSVFYLQPDPLMPA